MRIFSLVFWIWSTGTLSAGLIEKKIYSVGAYKIVAALESAPNGGQVLQLSYSPYELYRHRAWTWSRYRTEGADPLGPRSYWDQISPAVLPRWRGNSDLAVSDTFTVTLTPSDPSGWSRLALTDTLVRDFMARFALREFLVANAPALRSLARHLQEEQGAPISLSDFNEVSLPRRDQYMVSEAVRSIDGHSVFFDDALGQAVASSQAARELPPRLPKLSRSPRPVRVHPLLVVHATTTFDAAYTAKAGIDHAIERFQLLGRPVIFLMDDDGDGDLGWYTRSRSPSYAVYSDGGEHNLDLRADDVTITGGFFGDTDGSHGCHFKALVDSISRYYLHRRGPLRVHLPMDAIYYYEDDRGMVKNFLSGKTAPEKFFEEIAKMLFFSEDDTVLGTDSSATGALSTRDYTFDFFWAGRPVYHRGEGRRHVELRFTPSV